MSMIFKYENLQKREKARKSGRKRRERERERERERNSAVKCLSLCRARAATKP